MGANNTITSVSGASVPCSQTLADFDHIVRLAKRLIGTPVARVALSDSLAVPEPSTKNDTLKPRFCGKSLASGPWQGVNAADVDNRACNILHDSEFRFCLGCRVTGPNGIKLGTLCVVDRVRRAYDVADLRLLSDLAVIAEDMVTSQTMAVVDELTKLCNRRGFKLLADKAFAAAERAKQEISLLAFDLDHFKRINDELGHVEGDNALCDFAHCLRKTFRRSDILARMGGDEFCALLNATESRAIKPLLARLKKNIAQRGLDQQRPYVLDFSVGLVTWQPTAPASLERLIAEADAAMYDNRRRSPQYFHATKRTGELRLG